MGRRIRVEGDLSAEELQERYRKASHPAEKTHWQVLWLIAEGKSAAQVAEVTGYTLNWVRALVGRYNREGPEAARDGRRHHSGRRPLLSPEQLAELPAALEGPAPRGGLWSGPEVARSWADRCGRSAGGSTCAGPARRHRFPDPDTAMRMPKPRRRFKRELPERVARECRTHPEAVVEVWGMDEHRIGLIPILRRVWAPRGKRPRAVVRPRYQWLYLVGFVHPESGRTSFWIVPQLTGEIFAAVLAAFIEEQGFDERKTLCNHMRCRWKRLNQDA